MDNGRDKVLSGKDLIEELTKKREEIKLLAEKKNNLIQVDFV